VQNTVGTYAADNDEFAGIKRLNFFRFFEEINTLLPVETTFDISTNMMYTKTNDLGTYCVMDMEIWLESLTAGMETEAEPEPDTETETVEVNTVDDQGGSLPGNIYETASIVETVNPDNSVVRTTRLSSMALCDVDASVVTMAETAATNNDEEYNVIFCVDTRDKDKLSIYKEYIEYIIDKIDASDRPKANIYWGDDRGEVGSSLYEQRNIGAEASINLSSAINQIFDLSNVVNTVLDNSGYNSIYSNRSDLETYVFIIFDPYETWSDGNESLQLLKNINGKNIHISLISGLTTYNVRRFSDQK
jgi:hypothetical protein